MAATLMERGIKPGASIIMAGSHWDKPDFVPSGTVFQYLNFIAPPNSPQFNPDRALAKTPEGKLIVSSMGDMRYILTPAPVPYTTERNRYWSGDTMLTPLNLKPERPDGPERWAVKPFNFSVYPIAAEDGRPAYHISTLDKLTARLQAPDTNNTLVDHPTATTDKSQLPQMTIRLGNGQLDSYMDPWDYVRMSDPRPLFLFTNVVTELPENIDAKYARQQIVRGAGHNGVIFRVDPNTHEIKEALWMSTQGNFYRITGSEQEILDSVALRIMVHNGEEFITNRQDYIPIKEEKSLVTWDDWEKDSLHYELWNMARVFHSLGLLEDKVDLIEFTQDRPGHARLIMSAINRSALGEGMYSYFRRKLKVLAVSPSGGGKVEWPSYLAKDHHLVPVGFLTPTGYAVYTPEGAPDGISYANGSVETAENMDAILMRQKFASGEVRNLLDYELWKQEQFKKYGLIPIYQENAPDEDLAVFHGHFHPEDNFENNDKLEIVEPDYSLYPRIDMACGGRGGNGALRSALARSKFFTSREALGDKVVGVRLPGHGMVFFATKPEYIVKAVVENRINKRPPGMV